MGDDDNWDDGPSTSGGKFDYGTMNKFGGGSESNAGGGDGESSSFKGRGGGGFTRNNDNENSEGSSFRGRGGRGGFRGRGAGGGFNRDNDDGGSGGGGGFQGRRGGFNRNGNDDDGGSGGRGGFQGRRGGFNRDGNDDDGGSRGGSGGRGGFRGRGRGGGGFRSNDEDGGSQDGGFGGRRNNDDNESSGGRGRGRGGFGRDQNRDNEDGEPMDEGGPEERKVPLYIPEEPSNDEAVIFGDRISAGINFSQYKNIKVNINGNNPVSPISSFEECKFKNLIMENIKKSGYTEPTPIQKYSIPILLAGRDLMGCAQTGSGKTMAFMLPIVQYLMDNPREDVSIETLSEPRALIVSPTRELTIQIFEQARKLARDSVLKICLAYGGAGLRHQGNKIAAGCDILVGTTGRLVDLMNRGIVRFSSVKFLVMDEADRMLDMGFLPDMSKIGDHETMPKAGERQTVMFSATFPKTIQEIAARFLHDYLFVCVGIVGGACLDIEQTFLEVSLRDKKAKFFELMEELKQEGKVDGILVFVAEKRNADIYASLLSQKGYQATSLHGDRFQQQREQAIGEFKSGRKNILVATSVAARGLDAKVSYVIQIDMPMDIDEYVHRIGRTGRIGNKGKAITFFNPDRDAKHIENLKQILAGANQTVPDWLNEGGGSGGNYRGDSGGFGAEDCRDFTANNKPQPMEAVEAEEDW